MTQIMPFNITLITVFSPQKYTKVKYKYFSHNIPEEGAKYTHLKFLKVQNIGKMTAFMKIPTCAVCLSAIYWSADT